jgi:DNA polymerase-3 subunit delta'
VPIIPLYGHAALRARFRDSVTRNALPSSLLLHGPRGVGKQRLAIWLGQLLLCTAPGERPCGACEQCRFAGELAHPDLRWFFPRPRKAVSDSDVEGVLEDYTDAMKERAATGGLYAPPSGTEGIFVATVRAIVSIASFTPALARRKVFVIGDADRMISQEGSDQAANAFLKLLEEPPDDTNIILTTSEPGALLPTIRSRVISIRVPPLSDTDVRAFLADPLAQRALDAPKGKKLEELVRLAAGAPGALLASDSRTEALEAARTLLAAARKGRAERLRAAMTLGAAGARGFFSDVLDALSILLRELVQSSLSAGDVPAALAAGRAIDLVERAKIRAAGNINPQLMGAALLRDIAELLR